MRRWQEVWSSWHAWPRVTTKDGKRRIQTLMGRAIIEMNSDGSGGTICGWDQGDWEQKEVIDPQQESEPRSGEVKADLNPNILDMTKLPPTAMALLEQLMATLSKKGKSPEGEQEIKISESGAVSKVDVPESSTQGEARGN
jgi:hypothetical protein